MESMVSKRWQTVIPAAIRRRHNIREGDMADALIAASAHRYGATLLHKDPEFDALLDTIKQERLPYKATGKAR